MDATTAFGANANDAKNGGVDGRNLRHRKLQQGFTPIPPTSSELGSESSSMDSSEEEETGPTDVRHLVGQDAEVRSTIVL